MSEDPVMPNIPPQDAKETQHRGWPLAWHLVALALAAFVPAIALSGWLLMRHISEAQQHIERSAVTQAEMWAQSADQVLSGSVAALRALTTSRALTAGNYELFGVQAATSFAGTGINVRPRDATMKWLGATPAAAAIDAEPPLSADELRVALASAEPFVTGFRSESAIGPSGVDIWIRAGPVTAKPALFLQARVPSQYLSRSLSEPSGGTHWSVALIDKTQRVLARSRSETTDFGARLATVHTDWPINSSQPAAVLRGVDAKGAPIIEALAAASVPGWRIATTAPRSVVEQRLDEHWRGFLLVATLLGCIMAGATTYVASSISRSVSTLSANAKSLASGAPFAPMSTTIGEVRDLMDTMSETRAELVRQKAALRDSDHRLRMALDAGGMGVWEWDRVTDEMIWDPVEFDLAGLPRGERAPKGKEFTERVLEQDRASLMDGLGGLSPENPAFAVDFRFKRYDGEVRWLSSRGLLISDQDGAPRGLIGVNYDMTEQRENVDRTAALLREVSHRSKNMLALILAMARLTARDATDVQSHLKQFSARVAGLAASQDLIVAADWQSVDIAALAAAEAKAIAHDGSERINLKGPDLCILPEAAQTLGMVFAELTLNAMQHGALTAARGRVDLTWDIASDRLQMAWRETGGPPILGKCRQGYGMSVVQRFAEQGLKADAAVDPRPEGLVWTLSAPLENIAVQPVGPC